MSIGIEATHANKKERTGVGEVCFKIINELKKIIPPETRVVLYSNKPLLEDLSVLPKNWSIKILSWPLKKFWSQVRLSLEFLFHPPDVFFAPGQLIPFFVPQKTAVFVHDSAFEALPQAYNFWGRQYLKWMNRRIAKKARLIFTSTEFNKKEIVKYYGAEVGERVRVVPLAYDSKRFKKPDQTLNPNVQFLNVLEKYGIKQPYILSVGRLEEKKNTSAIVRVFDKLCEKYNLNLVLCGNPGVGFEKVKKEIGGAKNKNKIILLGHVGADDLPALYAGAKVFVFPSFYEGFGLPVLEAMASGCPVVASDLPALREVGGEAAVFAHPQKDDDIFSAIEKILNDPILREEKIKLGLERIKLFSWEKTAEKIWKEMA